MIESFVDLTYRGLSLGRRVKLTQVRPASGYVETPAPMPVGTAIVITTDEGVVLDAIVTAIHEQVGGSDQPPGMVVTPALGDDARVSWWSARIAPESPPEPPPAIARTVSDRVTVRPRSHTVPAPPPEGVAVEPLVAQAEPPDGRTIAMAAVIPDLEAPAGSTDDDRPTSVMQAIDQDTLARLTAKSELDVLVTTGRHAVIDDGKQTVMMDAIDPAALGLDVSASGSFPAADEDSGAPGSGGDDKKAGGGGKKRRKRR